MPLTNDETPPESGNAAEPSPPVPERDAARTLDEITGVLNRMLALAELSASGLPVDRQLLQKTFERLQDELDRLAGGM